MSNFPLFDRAEELGVFNAQRGWLISAPTASGKSQIGREVIKRNLLSKPAMEVFLYLVPFKELAEEVFARLRGELPPQTRLFIKTGDYDKPFDAHEADVIVATYESVDGMIQQGMKFQPTILVADEFSIISDEARGAKIESLIAYLGKIWDGTVPYILSAVLDDPERISKWLGISLLKGTKDDRPVPLDPFEIPYSKGKKDDTVEKLLKENLPNNFLIFCYTKRGTEKLAFNIADVVSKHMSGDEKIRASQFAETLKIDFPYVVGIPELISKGVAYHHSNLEVDLRNRISVAFRERIIKVVVATTTLAAGINMPARFVIVRDVERYPAGLIPVSEMVNMLGRAGRPTLDTKGTGLFMVDRLKMKGSDYEQFIEHVKDSKVERIES